VSFVARMTALTSIISEHYVTSERGEEQNDQLGSYGWPHANVRLSSSAIPATVTYTIMEQQETSLPEGDDTGFWRAVCAERRMHGSEGGVEKRMRPSRKTTTTCRAPLLPYRTQTEDGRRFTAFGVTRQQAIYRAHQKAKAYGRYAYPTGNEAAS
jgi:hypothetical protein